MLAGLAGMAVANRAMRPIAALTAAAARHRHDPRPLAAGSPSRRATTRSPSSPARSIRCSASSTPRGPRPRDDQAPARVRRRRLPRAAHAADQHPRQPRAARGVAEHGRPDADEGERAAVASALRSSKRMNRLVGDLLLLARADAGRVGRRAECDLALIAAEALEEVGPVSDGHRFTSTADRRRPRSPAIPTSCIGWSSTCSRTRSATPRRAPRSTSSSASEAASRPAAGQRRRPGPAGGDGVAGLRALRPRRRAPPIGPPATAPAPASGSRSCAPSRSLTAAAVAARRSESRRRRLRRHAAAAGRRTKFERTLPRLEDSFRSEVEYLPWTRQQPSRSSPIAARLAPPEPIGPPAPSRPGAYFGPAAETAPRLTAPAGLVFARISLAQHPRVAFTDASGSGARPGIGGCGRRPRAAGLGDFVAVRGPGRAAEQVDRALPTSTADGLDPGRALVIGAPALTRERIRLRDVRDPGESSARAGVRGSRRWFQR